MVLQCCENMVKAGSAGGPRGAQLDHYAKKMHFPLWVVSVKTFLAMEGAPMNFQELMAEGKLVRWVPTMYLIFVSHQWLGNREADPEGKQARVLRAALRNIISGAVVVQSGLIQFLGQGNVERMGPDEVRELEDGYLWLDWFSIPQITVRDADEQVSQDVKNAVLSIPMYVEAADMFVALVPCQKHTEQPMICNMRSWETRGWCRVELAAAAMSYRAKRRLVMVSSEKRVSMFSPFQCDSVAPGLGSFTVESDRELVLPVMEDIVQSYVESLWLTGVKHKARLFEAMRGVLVFRLGKEEEQHQLAASLSQQGLKDFLLRFRFQCLEEAVGNAEQGFGPVCCAAVSGNKEVLRSLAAARANMNESFQETDPQLLVYRGITAVSLMLKFAPNVEVLETLVELQADVAIKDSGGRSPLSNAAMGLNLDCITALIRMRADVDEASHVTGGTCLLEASGAGHPEAVKLLLEHGASIDAVNLLGYTPLSSAAFSGSLPCVQHLLERKADVNAIPQARGALGFTLPVGICLAKSLGLLPTSGPMVDLLMSDGATACFQAAYLGHTCVLELLLEARADPSIPNSAGISPLEAAALGGHPQEMLDLLKRHSL